MFVRKHYGRSVTVGPPELEDPAHDALWQHGSALKGRMRPPER